jgi:hypothetical protein
MYSLDLLGLLLKQLGKVQNKNSKENPKLKVKSNKENKVSLSKRSKRDKKELRRTNSDFTSLLLALASNHTISNRKRLNTPRVQRTNIKPDVNLESLKREDSKHTLGKAKSKIQLQRETINITTLFKESTNEKNKLSSNNSSLNINSSKNKLLEKQYKLIEPKTIEKPIKKKAVLSSNEKKENSLLQHTTETETKISLKHEDSTFSKRSNEGVQTQEKNFLRVFVEKHYKPLEGVVKFYANISRNETLHVLLNPKLGIAKFTILNSNSSLSTSLPILQGLIDNLNSLGFSNVSFSYGSFDDTRREGDRSKEQSKKFYQKVEIAKEKENFDLAVISGTVNIFV